MEHVNTKPHELTPSQRRTFTELLAADQPRPTSRPDLVEELRSRLLEGTKDAVAAWTESTLYLTKSQLITALRCEGQSVAYAAQTREPGMIPVVAVGNVAHRAIQIAHTHPGQNVVQYVEWAASALRSDEAFTALWDGGDVGVQSDLRMQAVSRVTSFLDSWPALNPRWTPRFEEPIVAKAGKLTLSARPDLVLGRPRGDGLQTMFLVDFKTGALKDEHEFEGRFYALVSALRHGVVPFRSCVYSLASGEWSDPEITEDVLVDTAERVVQGACSLVEVLTERREPKLVPGQYCRWCPAAATCPSAQS